MNSSGISAPIRRLAYAAAFALASFASAAWAGPAKYHPPRTSWGDPSLEGEWNNHSATRLERPRGVTGLVANPVDVPAILKAEYDSILPADPIGSRESEWWDLDKLASIDGQLRTSWITDPADGRIPYSDAGRKRLADWRAAAFVNYDGPEARNSSERCLTPSFSAGTPPYQNSPYASNYLIVQTREAVVLVSEMNDEVRIVRLNAPHARAGQRYWDGDSIGHWEKDTLVVETVGFHEIESFRAPVFFISQDAKVTERFTRVSPTEIRYAFTVEDPKTYTQVWKGEMPFRTSHERMLEYACHEGNHSLAGLLQGARYEEREAKEKAVAAR